MTPRRRSWAPQIRVWSYPEGPIGWEWCYGCEKCGKNEARFKSRAEANERVREVAESCDVKDCPEDA